MELGGPDLAQFLTARTLLGLGAGSLSIAAGFYVLIYTMRRARKTGWPHASLIVCTGVGAASALVVLFTSLEGRSSGLSKSLIVILSTVGVCLLLGITCIGGWRLWKHSHVRRSSESP